VQHELASSLMGCISLLHVLGQAACTSTRRTLGRTRSRPRATCMHGRDSFRPPGHRPSSKSKITCRTVLFMLVATLLRSGAKTGRLLAGHSVAQLTSCEPCMYRHHVCSRWQREIDKHARQSSLSAAPAERVDVASEVVRPAAVELAAGRASKLGLSWPGPSSMHVELQISCGVVPEVE